MLNAQPLGNAHDGGSKSVFARRRDPSQVRGQPAWWVVQSRSAAELSRISEDVDKHGGAYQLGKAASLPPGMPAGGAGTSGCLDARIALRMVLYMKKKPDTRHLVCTRVMFCIANRGIWFMLNGIGKSTNQNPKIS